MTAWQLIFTWTGIAACVLGAGFFSGMETGMNSLNGTKLMYWVRAGSKSAEKLRSFLANMQRTLAVVLVGTNLTNVLLSTFTAWIAAEFLSGKPGKQAALSFSAACLMIYLGEYMPKLLFRLNPLRRAIACATFFDISAKVLAPIASLVLFLTKWSVPKTGRKNDERFMISLDYLQDVLNPRKPGANISALERMMIQRVIALHTKTAADLLVPLEKIHKAKSTAPLQECFELAAKSGHSRLPVFNADWSRCIGIVDILEELAGNADPTVTKAGECVEPPVFVDADEFADDILPLMRKHRSPLLIVQDPKTKRPVGIISENMILRSLTASKR